MYVAVRADAGEAPGELAGPGGPLMLWLIDITWCAERASLDRSSPNTCYMSDEQFSSCMFGNLLRRSQGRAGAGRPIVGNQDVVKMPRRRAAVRANQH